MIILAHRGLWRRPAERNTIEALGAALAAGFGLETDIRDRDGGLVVSHDPPSGDSAFPLEALLDVCRRTGKNSMIAINVKSDGLQTMLSEALAAGGVGPERYFVFDMAVPDARGYLRLGMPCFTRASEIETVPAFLDRAAGVWIDCFERDWIDGDVILGHVRAGRKVALVSPELHGRDLAAAWSAWRAAHRALQADGKGDAVMLCTDHPEQARDYFA